MATKIFATFLVLVVSTNAFEQTFECDSAQKSFSDFALDLVILWDRVKEYDDNRFLNGIVKWVNWMQNTFGGLRVGTASYLDEVRNQKCYEPLRPLSSSPTGFTRDMLTEGIKFNHPPLLVPKTMALSGAMDAIMDPEMDWNYSTQSSKGKVQTRFVLVISDREIMVKNSYYYRPVWDPRQQNQCHRSDAPSDAALTRVLQKMDARILTLVKGNKNAQKAWDKFGSGQLDGQPYHFISTLFVSSFSRIDSELESEVTGGVWYKTLCEAWRSYIAKQATSSTTEVCL